jgi:hypothetical protein
MISVEGRGIGTVSMPSFTGDWMKQFHEKLMDPFYSPSEIC